MSMRIAVVGGGMTGLAAAWECSRRGAHVTVFESRAECGGLAGSSSWRGFRLDFGPHRLHPGAPERVLKLYRELLGDDLIERPRAGAIHLDDSRVVRYPLELPQMAVALGASKSLRLLSSAIAGRLSQPGAARNFSEGVAKKLGWELYEILYGPSARKVWGVDPRELDSVLASARVMRKGPLDVVLGALKRGSTKPGATYLYPRKGAGQLAESFVTQLRSRGASIRTRTKVRALTPRSVNGESFDAVISTAPLTQIAHVLDDASLLRSTSPLRYRGVVVLYVLVSRPFVAEQDVNYFPSETYPFARIFELKRFSASVGASDRTVIGFDLPTDPSSERWRFAASDWLPLVRNGLQKMGVRDEEILGATVRRRAEAYPVYLRGFRAARDEALHRLQSFDGLYVAGRSGLFVHNNINHAIDAGLDVGQAACERWPGREWGVQQQQHTAAVITD